MNNIRNIDDLTLISDISIMHTKTYAYKISKISIERFIFANSFHVQLPSVQKPLRILANFEKEKEIPEEKYIPKTHSSSYSSTKFEPLDSLYYYDSPDFKDPTIKTCLSCNNSIKT